MPVASDNVIHHPTLNPSCEVVASSNVIDRQTLAGSRYVELELISKEVIIKIKVLF